MTFFASHTDPAGSSELDWGFRRGRKALSMCIIASMLVIMMQTPQSGDMSVDDLVVAHQATVDAIHELDFILDSGREGSELVESVRYSSDGVRERFRIDMLHIPADNPKRFVDVLRDGDITKRLEGFDPNNPNVITDPLDSKRMNAAIRPWTVGAVEFKALGLLKLQFSIDPRDRHRTLGELSRDSRLVHGESAVTLVGSEKVAGQDCFHIRIIHPGINGDGTGLYANSEFRVFLDPTVGYLARRVDVHRKGHVAEEDYVITTTVSKFESFENGVYFPVELRATSLYGHSNPKPVSEPAVFHVRQLTVNAPLPVDAMDFKFPENILVGQEGANSEATVFLIGKNSEVVKTMKSREEVEAFLLSKQGEDPSVRPAGSLKILFAASTFVLLVAILWVARSRFKTS